MIGSVVCAVAALAAVAAAVAHIVAFKRVLDAEERRIEEAQRPQRARERPLVLR